MSALHYDTTWKRWRSTGAVLLSLAMVIAACQQARAQFATSARQAFLMDAETGAVLYQKAGFKHKAIEMWERAIGQSPDDATRGQIKEHLMSLL